MFSMVQVISLMLLLKCFLRILTLVLSLRSVSFAFSYSSSSLFRFACFFSGLCRRRKVVRHWTIDIIVSNVKWFVPERFAAFYLYVNVTRTPLVAIPVFCSSVSSKSGMQIQSNVCPAHQRCIFCILFFLRDEIKIYTCAIFLLGVAELQMRINVKKTLR